MSFRQKIGKYTRAKLGVTELRESLGKELDFLSALLNLGLPEVMIPPETVLTPISDRLKAEYGVSEFVPAIHKNDLMFQHHLYHSPGQAQEALWHYYRVGAMVAKNVAEIASKYKLSVSGVLDFGSGYGRVSRFLPTFFSAAECAVSEVKEGALQFQEEYFGFATVAHTTRAEEFPKGQYDLILALSVFTHLPQNLFEKWLNTLVGRLNEGGLLLFSYNNLDRIPRSHNASFYYTSQSEDSYFMVPDRLDDEEEYGLTYVSRAFLKKLAGKVDAQISFEYQGFTGTQEMAVIKK